VKGSGVGVACRIGRGASGDPSGADADALVEGLAVDRFGCGCQTVQAAITAQMATKETTSVTMRLRTRSFQLVSHQG
jgi:hypothetical protein